MDFRGVSIEVVGSDDHLIEIAVSARGDQFSGAVEVYAGHGELAGMAQQLAGFPASPNDAREFTFGSFTDGRGGGAASFRFYCVDGAGHSFAEVRLESRERRGGVCETVKLALPVEPAAVDEFVSQLRDIGSTFAGTAFLRKAF